MSELGHLLELMHTSEERWQTLRAKGREWRHATLHLEAFMRTVERRRPESVATYGDSYQGVEEPEQTETSWRLWMQGKNKVRAEFAAGDGDMVTVVVDGRTWWNWSPSTGPQTNEGRENSETGVGPGIALVRPAVVLPALDLEIQGRITKLGRSAHQVLAIPTTGADEESGSLLHGIGSGADEYELLVDAERGALLRTEARLGGRRFLVLDMDDVAFDDEIPADTFTLVPPTGEAFEPLPIPRWLLLEELPAAVSFTVLVPERVVDDAQVDVMIEPALHRYGVPEYVDITYHTFSRDTPPTFLALRESAEPMPMLDETEWRDIEGFKVGKDRHTAPATIQVRLELLGTYVELSSRDLSLEQLLDMSRSLVPLPPGPPS